MLVKDLLEKERAELAAVTDRITSYEYLSAIDIINDSSFERVKPKKEFNNELSNISLTHLNEKLANNKKTIEYLNALWVIKGLIYEISAVVNLKEEDFYEKDKYELDSVVRNLVKLRQKIDQLDERIFLVGELNQKYNELLQGTNNMLQLVARLFFPNSNVFARTVSLGESEMTYEEFLNLCDELEEKNSLMITKKLRHELQVGWDKGLLADILERNRKAGLSKTDSQYKLDTSQKSHNFEDYISSLSEFMCFINLFDNQNFKNYFLSRISNDLVDKISQNINYFVCDSNSKWLGLVTSIIDLSKSLGWSLSIEKSLGIQEDLSGSLRGLYIKWMSNKYIDRIRRVFTEGFEIKLKDLSEGEFLEQASYLKDDYQSRQGSEKDWNEYFESDGWDNAEDVEHVNERADEEVDNENDGWNFAWEEDDWAEGFEEKPQDLPTNIKNKNTTYVTSRIPDELYEIFTEYQQVCGKEDTRILLSTVLAIASISYPSLSQSFLLYNDLFCLNLKIKSQALSKFLEINLGQVFQTCCNELTVQVLSLDLSYANDSESLNERYTLEKSDHSNLDSISKWYIGLAKLELKTTNMGLFRKLVFQTFTAAINLLCKSIISIKTITEYQSSRLTNIIEFFEGITNNALLDTGISNGEFPLLNKLANIRFMVNGHLRDIMDRFYQGELFDLETEELVALIKSLFVESDLRNNYTREIYEIRGT